MSESHPHFLCPLFIISTIISLWQTPDLAPALLGPHETNPPSLEVDPQDHETTETAQGREADHPDHAATTTTDLNNESATTTGTEMVAELEAMAVSNGRTRVLEKSHATGATED